MTLDILLYNTVAEGQETTNIAYNKKLMYPADRQIIVVTLLSPCEVTDQASSSSSTYLSQGQIHVNRKRYSFLYRTAVLLDDDSVMAALQYGAPSPASSLRCSLPSGYVTKIWLGGRGGALLRFLLVFAFGHLLPSLLALLTALLLLLPLEQEACSMRPLY